jgi:hypothetical protein
MDDHVASDAALSDGDFAVNTCLLSPAPVGKKQKHQVRDVTEVRHSKRIAKICDGFKDKDSSMLAKNKAVIDNSQTATTRGKKKQAKKSAKDSKEIISKAFSANIIDSDAPPPSELPISTVQCIGVEHCMIPPSEVSVEKLTSNSH